MNILKILLSILVTISVAHADDGDDLLDESDAQEKAIAAPKSVKTLPKPELKAAPAPDKEKSRWSVLLPLFVMHGELPANGAQYNMPRKIDPRGRFVATPGIGAEWEGKKSLDVIAAFIKDCYDDAAGTVQVGQYFKLSRSTRLGYTLGLYIRQTPIACYTQTRSSASQSAVHPRFPGLGGGGGLLGNQPQTNTLSTTTCLFEDNLPIRYTFRMGNGYVDIIPTPFLNFSTRLYDGAVQVLFKFITNYYLTEFGIAIAW